MSSMNAMRKLLHRSELAAWAAALLVLGATRSIAQQNLPRTTPETVGVSSQRLQRIGEAIQRHLRQGQSTPFFSFFSTPSLPPLPFPPSSLFLSL